MPELVSYIRNLIFQSSSFSPLDRFLLRFVYIAILAARVRVARFNIVYPIAQNKFYASIQRVSEQFPNYPLINSFWRTCRRTGSCELPATVAPSRVITNDNRSRHSSTIRLRCRTFGCLPSFHLSTRPALLAGQCRLLRRHLTPPEYRYVLILSFIRLSNGRSVF